MLTDWERQQWAALEERLSADPELARAAVAPSRLRRRWEDFQERYYPAVYLASALGYMVAAMGGWQVVLLYGVALLVALGWVVVQKASGR